jgi:hypothetical protein
MSFTNRSGASGLSLRNGARLAFDSVCQKSSLWPRRSPRASRSSAASALLV